MAPRDKTTDRSPLSHRCRVFNEEVSVVLVEAFLLVFFVFGHLKRERPASLEALGMLVVMGRIELPTYGL